jgi:PAS domain S-box-containing protein
MTTPTPLPPMSGRTPAGTDDVPFGRITDEGQLRSAMQTSGAAFVVVDPALRIRDNNQALFEQSGSRHPSLLGTPVCDLLHPSVRPVLLRQLERLVQLRDRIFVEHLTALWEADSRASGTVVGVANRGPGRQVESILLMVNSEESTDERRTLISPTKLLTKVNAQILEGVAAGAPTVQLASRLYLSRQGVEYHVSHMLRQFKVPNRAALVSKSYAMGLFKIGSWPPRVLTDYIRA